MGVVVLVDVVVVIEDVLDRVVVIYAICYISVSKVRDHHSPEGLLTMTGALFEISILAPYAS